MTSRHGHLATLSVALVVASCTTDFSTPGDQDTFTDPASDTSLDPADDTGADPSTDPIPSDSTDVTTDTLPPPEVVRCDELQSMEVPYTDGTSLQYGCDIAEGCPRVGIWMQVVNDQYVVISGGEYRWEIHGTFLYGATVTRDGSFESSSPMELLHPEPGDSFEISVGDASLVNRSMSLASLIYPVRSWTGTGDPIQNIRSLNVWPDGSGGIGYQYRDLLPNATGTPDARRITHLRGVLADWGRYFIFFMMEEETPLFFVNQLFGASIAQDDFGEPGVVFPIGTGFTALQLTASATRFPVTPEVSADSVLLPFMDLDMSTDIGSFGVGLWVLDPDRIGGTYVPPTVFMSSSKVYNAAPALTRLHGLGAMALGGMATDQRFSLSGVAPPYELNVAVEMDLSSPPVAEGAIPVADGLMRDMNAFDFLDAKILFDPGRGIFHYVAMMFEQPGGNTRVHVYSFLADGTPAMADGRPFIWDTGTFLVPAFDAIIDPDSGHLIFVSYPGSPDGGGSVESYLLTEIECNRTTP